MAKGFTCKACNDRYHSGGAVLIHWQERRSCPWCKSSEHLMRVTVTSKGNAYYDRADDATSSKSTSGQATNNQAHRKPQERG